MLYPIRYCESAALPAKRKVLSARPRFLHSDSIYFDIWRCFDCGGRKVSFKLRTCLGKREDEKRYIF